MIPAEPCCRAWLAKGPAARPRKCAAGTATRCPAHGCDAATALGRAAFLVTIAIGGVLSAVALLKGRLWLGVLGLLFPLLALIGTLRLARPNSPWARWRYRPGSRKSAKTAARAGRHKVRGRRLKHRIFDAVAGRPTSVVPVRHDEPELPPADRDTPRDDSPPVR